MPDGSCGQPGGFGRATLKRLSIRPCTGRGLPGRRVTTAPVRSYRTFSPSQPDQPACCVFSVALSLGFPPLDVIQRPALRCPDFPREPHSRAPPRLPGLPLEYTASRAGRRCQVAWSARCAPGWGSPWQSGTPPDARCRSLAVRAPLLCIWGTERWGSACGTGIRKEGR